MRPRLVLVAVLMLVVSARTRAESEADQFGRHVAPIFRAHCLECHQENRREGDLSLEDPGELIRQGHVVPGSPSESGLLDLITPVDGDADMPRESQPLGQAERDAIRRWILEGAEIGEGVRLAPPGIADLEWWSLKPLARLNSPLTALQVDAFLDRRRQEKHLVPLPQADPITLIRRLTFDLHGLPPTPAEIDAFLLAYRSDREAAWSRLVERLLADPAFGEKWGQHWLDIARYAETHGYDKDQPRRNAWPYRDYVIASFNADKPYAQFVREQVAGDAMAENPSEGIVATGFLAAGPWDLIAHQEVGEAKLDGRIAKHLDRDEMLAAVFNVFQSTTIQCAQCHDHKFDPIRSEDYYRGQAVFSAIDRANRVYRGRTDEQTAEHASLTASIDKLKQTRSREISRIEALTQSATADLSSQIDDLESQIRKNSPPSRHGFHSQIADSPEVQKWIQIDLGKPTPLEKIELFACHDDFNGIGPGFGFPVRFKLETDDAEQFRPQHAHTVLDQTGADFPNPEGFGVSADLQGRSVRHLRLTASKLAERKQDYILALGEMRAIGADGTTNHARNAKVSFSDSIPANARWAPAFLVDELFHHWSAPPETRKRLHRLHESRQKTVTELVPQGHEARLKAWNDQLRKLEERLAKIPSGQMTYSVATDFKRAGQFKPTGGVHRSVSLLRRGDLRSPVKRVFPGAPVLWPQAPTEFISHERRHDYPEQEGRVALANYLCAPENPLLWRSIANRVWQWTFGRPLVATPNDFGRMGAQPSHPELLDAIAASLRDDPDQSLKSLVRRLVSTKAYRLASQSETSSPRDNRQSENSRADGNNQFLWRANRRRLTAEEFRDSLLAVSGGLRLSDRGGPSFQDFVIEQPQHSPHYEYGKHDPNDVTSHRRTIYRFVVRSQPQPMLTTLDCADPSISVARRDESTTSLQALATWNNPLVEAMSRQMADRLATTQNRRDRITLACRLTWGRPPSETEYRLLAKLDREQGGPTLCRVLFNSSAMLYID